MQKKKKILMIAIMPAVMGVVVIGGLLSFILIAGMGHGAAATATADAVPAVVAASAAGAPGVSEGSSGSSAGSAGDEGAAQAPAPVATDAVACDFTDMVGKPADTAALDATHRPYRVIKPGQPVTMDYSAARINVEVDDAGTVTGVHCG